MGLLPMNIDILPPSDDRVFKLILTSPDAKPVLMNLISSCIGQRVVDVEVRNNELPPGDTEEKAERLDVNCRIDDGSHYVELSKLDEIIKKSVNDMTDLEKWADEHKPRRTGTRRIPQQKNVPNRYAI